MVNGLLSKKRNSILAMCFYDHHNRDKFSQVIDDRSEEKDAFRRRVEQEDTHVELTEVEDRWPLVEERREFGKKFKIVFKPHVTNDFVKQTPRMANLC